MLVKLFYTILFIGGGISILKFRKKVKSLVGDIALAEKYLGTGSSYFIIILVGIIMIYIGVIYFFGGIEGFQINQK